MTSKGVCCCRWCSTASTSPSGSASQAPSSCTTRWILAYYGFPYPISLTMWHMAFSSVLAFLCVRLGYVPAVNMTSGTYMKAIVPIGALFAGKASCRRSVTT